MSKKTKTPIALDAVAQAQEDIRLAQERLNTLRLAQAAQATAERDALLKKVNTLPGMFGVNTVSEAIALIRNATRTKGTRQTITPELGAKIDAALKAGGQTTKQIAESFNVSAPTVSQRKKKLGLTVTRK